jgi:hypothetical protein
MMRRAVQQWNSMRMPALLDGAFTLRTLFASPIPCET